MWNRRCGIGPKTLDVRFPELTRVSIAAEKFIGAAPFFGVRNRATFSDRNTSDYPLPYRQGALRAENTAHAANFLCGFDPPRYSVEVDWTLLSPSSPPN